MRNPHQFFILLILGLSFLFAGSPQCATAPSGVVILNSNSQIVGFVVCDQAILNNNGQLNGTGQ